MKEHDWVKLYADADKFMKKVGGTDFNVKTNIKTERCGEGIVKILKAAVEEIYTGGLAKVTLNLRGGVKASISQNSKGEINVERTETKKQKLTE